MNTQALRILLVDDNPLDRELAIRALRQAYATAAIHEVADRAQFETALATGGFDLVITDYQLQWSDGLVVLQTVKALDPLCPVIMFTGTGTEEIAVAAMKSGLDDYVIKRPQHYVRLATAAQSALERADARRRLAALEQERDALLAREQMAHRRATYLAEVSVVLAASLNSQRTLQQIAELSVPAVSDWCGVYLAAPDGTPQLVTVAHVDPSRIPLAFELHHRYPPQGDASDSVSGVLRTGEPVVISPVSDAMLVAGARDADHLALMRAIGIAAFIIVPLRARGRILGAITYVASTEERPFGSAELDLATEVARRAALALDSAQVHEATERQAREAQALADVGRELAELNQDLRLVLDRVARRGAELLDGACAVRLLSTDRSFLELMALYHPDAGLTELARELLTRWPQRADEGITAQVVQSGRTVLIPQVDPEAAWRAVRPEYRPHLERYPIAGLLVVPLRVREQTLGVLSVTRYGGQPPFNPADQAFLERLAERAALAIENARLYREAQEAITLRDSFLSIAAHELRTPLTTLIGQAQLIERRAARDADLPERHLRSVQIVIAQGHRLNRLVLAMLDIVRIDQGRLHLERAPVDLAALVQRVLEESRPLHEAHALSYAGVDAPLLVLGDALRLEQIVLNLLENAVKYSPRGSAVQVATGREFDQARVTVSDQGMGIPAQALPHIFERFYRADNIDPRQVSGIGIGLSVVREIVELHGGRIAVESQEGQGSTFTVYLPLLPPAEGEG
jgi:signal transduction histidine kinase/DNA-binding response OmpR family regulator